MSMPKTMQRLTLRREITSNKATLGILSIGGKEAARTLENPWLDNKTNISCIPLGTYKGHKDNTGRFRYWALSGVEGRSGVEIHQGNREKDTHGCIIIGDRWGFLEEELAVFNSKNTLKKLQNIIEDEFEITII